LRRRALSFARKTPTIGAFSPRIFLGRPNSKSRAIAPISKIFLQFQCDLPCPVPCKKIFCFSELKITPISSPSRPLKGCFANVTNAGWDAVDAAASGTTRDGRAGEAACELSTASRRPALKPGEAFGVRRVCPVEALAETGSCVRRNRVVLMPRRWCQVSRRSVGPTGRGQNLNPQGDGGKKARSPGRTRISRKLLRGGAGRSRCNGGD
jgi:hypothetical protein